MTLIKLAQSVRATIGCSCPEALDVARRIQFFIAHPDANPLCALAGELGCCRFHGHLDKVENGAGGGTWLREGSLRKSSRLRQSG